MISFILFLVQSFADHMDASLLHAFEYSHLLIFAFALCYIIQSALLLASIKPIKKNLIKQNALANEATVKGEPVSLANWGFQVRFRVELVLIRSTSITNDINITLKSIHSTPGVPQQVHLATAAAPHLPLRPLPDHHL